MQKIEFMSLIDVLVIGGGAAGLATARQLHSAGLSPVVVETSDRPGGSWRAYYESLTLFSPRRHSALPGLAFPGPPKGYPTRDEVVAYLDLYARQTQVPVLTDSRVIRLLKTSWGFSAELADGRTLQARSVVAATGGFGSPNRPVFRGEEHFQGRVLHSADYRTPWTFAGEGVLVVGGGNTAIQIATELAVHTADIWLASRSPLRFLPQRLLGADLHDGLKHTGLDKTRLLSDQGVPIIDDGRYRRALRRNRPARLPLFDRFTPTGVQWADGVRRDFDTVIYATGYRPSVDFLETVPGALNEAGRPLQRSGVARDVAGLYFVGLPLQRNFASATLRGFGPDAAWIARAIIKARRAEAAGPSR